MSTKMDQGNGASFPRPGKVHEIHVCGREVIHIGIKPIRQFENDWGNILVDAPAIDSRFAYFGIVHDQGASLVAIVPVASIDRAVS